MFIIPVSIITYSRCIHVRNISFGYRYTISKKALLCLDPCLQKPCKNGGTCTVQRGRYQCSCKTGYSGTMCLRTKTTITITTTTTSKYVYLIYSFTIFISGLVFHEGLTICALKLECQLGSTTSHDVKQ